VNIDSTTHQLWQCGTSQNYLTPGRRFDNLWQPYFTENLASSSHVVATLTFNQLTVSSDNLKFDLIWPTNNYFSYRRAQPNLVPRVSLLCTLERHLTKLPVPTRDKIALKSLACSRLSVNGALSNARGRVTCDNSSTDEESDWPVRTKVAHLF